MSVRTDRLYRPHQKSLPKRLLGCWQLYVILLPAVLYYILFLYSPMVGIQIAFRDFTPRGGIWGSKWVGAKHFERFFRSPQFSNLIVNTLRITVSSLIFTFPFPVLLALLFNECRFTRFKKVVQTLTYAPHFISTVVFVSMITLFLNKNTGIINTLISSLGGARKDFLGDKNAFVPIFLISGVWQNCGWSAIIYVAALAGVDQQLHEAALMDGANRFQRIWYVDLPSILPTMAILFIMSCGSLLNVGYEKVYLMQNSLNTSVSEVISTYVYKVGLLQNHYSYTAAIGSFNAVVNVVLLVITNTLSKRLTEVSMF